MPLNITGFSFSFSQTIHLLKIGVCDCLNSFFICLQTKHMNYPLRCTSLIAFLFLASTIVFAQSKNVKAIIALMHERRSVVPFTIYSYLNLQL